MLFKKSGSEQKPQSLVDWILGGARGVTSLAYLDGLRGIAVLFVILGHYSGFDPTGFWRTAIAPGATSGVYLFFLLSSFLLTTLLINGLRKNPTGPELIAYFRRRFLRIYPMFTLTLVVILLVPAYYAAIFGSDKVTWYSQFFLLHTRSIFWAISVEFEFYLLLPFIALAFSHGTRRTRLGLILALLAAFIARWIFGLYHPGYFPNAYPHLPAYITIFFLGSAIAMSKILIEDGLLPAPPSWIASLILLAGWFGQLWSLPLGGMLTLQDYASNPWHLVAGEQGGNALLWGCVLFGLVYGSGAFRQWLSAGWIRWIGIVSYSAYLTHILVARDVVSPLLPRLGFELTMLATILATLILSTITFILIERPFMRLR
jgi:peptidoglycan/LPS O-acetylase OafA/YrhL